MQDDGMRPPAVDMSTPGMGTAHAGTGSDGAQGLPKNLRTLYFQFTGSGAEYFKIWIVNLALTVVTFGIYSAWAKVRNKNYFYRNTVIDGASFEYLGEPLKILKGRMIVGGILLAMAISQRVAMEVYLVLVALVALLAPALFTLSKAFNARYSSYRNVRFGFAGRFGQAYGTAVVSLLAYIFTLGLGLPYAQWRIGKFVMGKHRYGKTPFSWTATLGDYYKVYVTAIAFVLPGAVLLIWGAMDLTRSAGRAPTPDTVSVMFAAFGVFYLGALVAAGYVQAKLANVVLGSLSVGPHRFESNQAPLAVIWIFLSNAFAVLFSLGLLIPWAKVRLTRYRLEHLRVHAIGDIVAESDPTGHELGALGDAATDLGDLDFDFGL